MAEQPKAAGLTLAEKIAAASIAVGKFTPDKRNPEQNYDYISADAVLARGGDALARAGVSVMPSLVGVEVVTVERPNKSPRQDARVSFVMIVSDGTDTRELMWFGFGSDYSVPDKAVYKAITSGHKYFLMKLLNIGAGNEDGEHETPDDAPTRKPPAKRQAEPEQAAQEPAREIVKQAAIKTANWPAIAARVAHDVPYYMRDGKPALVHILRAAAAEGFAEVTDANAEPLIEALAARVARKQSEAGKSE